MVHHGGFGFKVDSSNRFGNALGCPIPAPGATTFFQACRDDRAEEAKELCQTVTGVDCIDGVDAALTTAAEDFFPLAQLPDETDFVIENEVDNVAVTGYVQGSVEVTEKLTLEGGLRLSFEKKKIHRNQKTLPSGTLVIEDARNDESWTEFLPNAMLQHLVQEREGPRHAELAPDDYVFR